MVTLRSAESSSWPSIFGLAFWIALAGLTPTGLILAAAVALTCVAATGTGLSRRRCAAIVLGDSTLAALPWLTAAILGLSSTDRMWAHTPGIAAFAARAEPALGTVGSLASLGGIWNGDAVPDSRATYFTLVSAVVLLTLVAAGFLRLRHSPSTRPLLVLGVVSILTPAALATGPGLAVLHAIVEAVPSLGVLRDAQKWVALAMPGYTLAGAGAVLTLRRWLGFSGPTGAPLVCCAALLLALPDLAWGVGGKLQSVHYPGDWAAVAGMINRAPAEVAVLPADTMRRFTWSGPAPVLDPLPRWLRADVLTTGDLTVSGTTVLGEGDRARDVQRLLLAGADPDQLRGAGVGWLVVEEGTAGDMSAATETLERLPVAYRGRDLMLYRVGGDTAGASAGRRTAVLIAHLVWLVMLFGGAVGAAVAGRRLSSDHAADAITGDD